MVLENCVKLCLTEPDFPEKVFLLQKLGKWTKNRPKTWLFQFIENFGHYFLLNLFYNEDIYYLLCPCTDPIIGETFFLRNGPKCCQPIRLLDFFINHISRTNQWKSLIFFHVDTNSLKLKVGQKTFGLAWSKMSVASLVMGP